MQLCHIQAKWRLWIFDQQFVSPSAALAALLALYHYLVFDSSLSFNMFTPQQTKFQWSVEGCHGWRGIWNIMGIVLKSKCTYIKRKLIYSSAVLLLVIHSHGSNSLKKNPCLTSLIYICTKYFVIATLSLYATALPNYIFKIMLSRLTYIYQDLTWFH